VRVSTMTAPNARARRVPTLRLFRESMMLLECCQRQENGHA
jgi:hypothetical protein